MRTTFTAVASLAMAASVFGAVSHDTMAKHVKRVPAAGGPTDVEILNYALTLEYLERDFYAEGLAKYDAYAFSKAGYPSKVRERIVSIGSQEKAHVAFLAGALGSAGVSECKYDFGIDSVKTFLAIAQILEGVGVTAYLGAAPDITSAQYLAYAGAILTIEARHSSYLNEVNGVSGFPNPYDAALDYSQVYSLAAPFIIPGTCGTSGTLPPGIKAYPKLTVKTAVPRAGRKIGLHFDIPAGYTGPYYAAFINGLTTTYVPIDASSGVSTVPSGLSGATYLIISKDQEALADANTIAGPAILIL